VTLFINSVTDRRLDQEMGPKSRENRLSENGHGR
jgi:hypothetical protein